MSNVMAAMRLDYHSIKGNYFILALAYALAAVLGIFAKVPYIPVMVVMIIAGAASGTIFQVIDKNRLNWLYGVLPLKKAELVAGRYLYTLLFGLVNCAAAAALTELLKLITGEAMDPLVFQAAVAGAFLYFCLFVALVFPIYFRFGFSKFYIFINLPMYLLFILLLTFMRKNDLTKTLPQIIKYFTANPAMIWVIGVGGGLALMAVSLAAAQLAYKNREL